MFSIGRHAIILYEYVKKTSETTMDAIKKTGIIAGAVVGGVVGGGISLVGKMANAKFVDDVGSSITSSAILTGELTGKIASGTVDAVSGKIINDRSRTGKGLDDLRGSGRQVVNNFLMNVGRIVDNGSEIAVGIKDRDGGKVAAGTKKLAKFAAVGAITVGAIKMTDDEERGKK